MSLRGRFAPSPNVEIIVPLLMNKRVGAEEWLCNINESVLGAWYPLQGQICCSQLSL